MQDDRKDEHSTNTNQTDPGMCYLHASSSDHSGETNSVAHSSVPSEDEEVIKSSESENGTVLVDDLNDLLNADTTRVSHEKSCISERSNAISETDTMTLHDILNQADGSLVPTTSGDTSEDMRASSSTTHLPSSSKEIIHMLIDMDNANYSKETAKAMETKSFVKELEEITPTTCFDSYSVSDLLKLCESYRDRVLQSGKSEDVEILLNINTVRTFQLFQCRPYRQSYQTHQKTLPRDHPIHVFSFSSYSHRFESSDPRGLSHRRAASIGCEQGGDEGGHLGSQHGRH